MSFIASAALGSPFGTTHVSKNTLKPSHTMAAFVPASTNSLIRLLNVSSIGASPASSSWRAWVPLCAQMMSGLILSELGECLVVVERRHMGRIDSGRDQGEGDDVGLHELEDSALAGEVRRVEEVFELGRRLAVQRCRVVAEDERVRRTADAVLKGEAVVELVLRDDRVVDRLEDGRP